MCSPGVSQGDVAPLEIPTGLSPKTSVGVRLIVFIKVPPGIPQEVSSVIIPRNFIKNFSRSSIGNSRRSLYTNSRRSSTGNFVRSLLVLPQILAGSWLVVLTRIPLKVLS